MLGCGRRICARFLLPQERERSIGMRPVTWVEAGAWALGSGLLLAWGAAQAWSEHARHRGLDAFRSAQSQETHAPAQVSTHRGGVFHSVDQSLWSPRRIAAFAATADDAAIPEAVLRIPAIDLEVPVYSGASEVNLNRGAARIAGTAAFGEQGNTGIAAHRDGFFRKLKDARLDSDVYVETLAGTARYRITEMSIVAPNEVGVLAPTTAPSLTLVTCYPFYYVGSAPERFIVRAELADDPYRSQAFGSRNAHVLAPGKDPAVAVRSGKP